MSSLRQIDPLGYWVVPRNQMEMLFLIQMEIPEKREFSLWKLKMGNLLGMTIENFLISYNITN